jgi:hypothetical protein
LRNRTANTQPLSFPFPINRAALFIVGNQVPITVILAPKTITPLSHLLSQISSLYSLRWPHPSQEQKWSDPS